MKLLFAAIVTAGLAIIGLSVPASAVTPPDSCFAFNAGLGRITDYYDHEGNNVANPACPRNVGIPSTIGGTSVTSIGDYAFYYSNLTSVSIPSGVTSIGDYAFYYSNLTSVSIPSSVISIESGAFSQNNLTSVSIPNASATMQHSSFVGNPITYMTIGTTTYTEQSPTTEPACFVLSGQTVTGYYQASPLVARDNGVLCGRNVTIPNSVTSIGSSSFSRTNLTSVTIPSSVTSIGGGAFAENQLTSVIIPSNVLNIGDEAFRGNQLTSVNIPSSVTSIGFGAFAVQSRWGANIESGRHGAPDLYSDNPSEAQQAYDSIWYVRLYTSDPTNPNNLVGGIFDEYWWTGDDGNANGVNDTLGGHLIIPASAELQYVNASNASLQTAQLFTGFMAGNYLTNYMATQGPVVPVPADPENPTLGEQAAIDDALSVYYRIGDEVTITPPAIAGYNTPPTQTFVLGAADNQYSYVYAAQGSGANTGGELAETGMSLSVVMGLSAAFLMTGLGSWLMSKRVKGMKL